MFQVRLVLRHDGGDRLVYGVSLSFRLVFLTIAAVLLFSLLSARKGPLFGPANAVPLVLLAISAAASLYNERWLFDRSLNTIEHHLGLLGLYRRQSFELDTLVRVELSSFRMGQVGGGESRRFFARSFVSISLVDAGGQVRKVDIAKASRLAEMRRTARAVADFCGIAFDDNVEQSA